MGIDKRHRHVTWGFLKLDRRHGDLPSIAPFWEGGWPGRQLGQVRWAGVVVEQWGCGVGGACSDCTGSGVTVRES